jgi:hypothetical protein
VIIMTRVLAKQSRSEEVEESTTQDRESSVQNSKYEPLDCEVSSTSPAFGFTQDGMYIQILRILKHVFYETSSKSFNVCCRPSYRISCIYLTEIMA